jgi:acyl-coenzyme A thioesterase PaaI-like protein
VREVETGLVRVDERTLLLHVRTQYFAQRLVHQVGSRVVALGAGTTHRVDFRLHDVAYLQRALLERAVVAEHLGLDLQRVRHRKMRAALASTPASPTWPPDSA